MRLIDADALANKLIETGKRKGESDLITQTMLWHLDRAPTANKWIPVEQELPEYGKAVLTITQDETYEVNHVIDEECGEWFWEDNGKVIAWMPLPEPFKGVTDGRD